MKIKNNKAFTLIELIVTIAVLGILVLLAAPKFSGHIKDAELTRGFADAKSIQKASEMYFMDNEDWPRLTDEPYTSEEIKAYSEHIYDTTGKEIQLNPSGNYYNIDYDKLSKYVKAPTNKENYILQNPVGKVFYMDKLTEAGKDRVDYANGSVPNEPEEPETPLYEYTSATFTNAGATGMTGPTQANLDRAYLGSVLESRVISNTGIQIWAVPKSGTYRIEAYGAKGQDADAAKGGTGAIMKGEFSLNINESLKILVGQRTNEKSIRGSGGGGASFVTKLDNTPLIVAGGGGGGGAHNVKNTGANATITNFGNTNGGKNDGLSSGGAGLTGNGLGIYDSSNKMALSFINGGPGGSKFEGGTGGFGGGAGGWGNGGGGGGYSGGNAYGGSSGNSYQGGGGGGSFNAGESQVNSVGHSGHGKVVITYIGE